MLYELRNRLARRMLLTMLLLVLSVGFVVACAQNAANIPPTPTNVPIPAPTSQPSIPAITMKAMDFSYDLPQTVPAGYVHITLINSGAELHQAQLVLLNTDVTFAQFRSALMQKGLLVMRQLGTLIGGPDVIPPGASLEVILHLPAGQYAVLSPIPARDGVRQYLKGMITSFTVTEPTNANQAQAPTANGEAVLKSFSFQLPTPVAVGSVMWQVSNQGKEPYEMNVLKLAPGKTAQDVIAFYTHPSGLPPFANVGGMSAISPGLSGWVKLNFVAGTYVALSLVFDKATSKPEFLLGMITSFTVQ